MSRDVSLYSPDRSTERSRELLERARRVVPGGAQTNSKSPSQFVQVFRRRTQNAPKEVASGTSMGTSTLII